MKHTVGKVPRTYEEKKAYKGQNEGSRPLKKFLLCKYQNYLGPTRTLTRHCFNQPSFQLNPKLHL